MKKKTKIILSVILSFFVLLSATIIGLAYYEYYGQYSAIINIDGTIRVDAFDCLYDDLRSSLLGYGSTPENPYVIDNAARLQNLIRLNNSGKLNKTRVAAGVDRYYFCFEFDEQTVEQVLDLAASGEISTIGNDTYPFSDELSGVIYSYNGNYYSGCLPKVTVLNGVVTNVVGDTDVEVGDSVGYADGVYVLIKTYTGAEPSGFNTETYVNLESDSINTVHQVVSNATVVADTTQVDIGFISNIASTAYVHDIILNNITIKAVEPAPKTVWDYLNDFLESSVLTITNTNNTNTSVTHTTEIEGDIDERHIGIFAGHIEGAAANISVAGTTNIEINTLGVNYYSKYTTVGYISEDARIGGTSYSQIASDGFLTGGNASGCLFADEIYEVKGSATIDSSKSIDGETHYKLTSIAENEDAKWPGTNGTSFSYGSFTFMCSNTNDTLSTIWNDSTGLKMLGLSEYDINTSVLYCADEYRFNSEISAGGSIIKSAASVKETEYAGISELQNGGSVVDAGKYLIVAKVEDATKSGGYAYYAIKLVAEEASNNSVTYDFDHTDAIDVTSYILDTTGSKKVPLSALWDVPQSTTNPIFANARFDGEYLTYNSPDVELTDNANNASPFRININDETVYYVVTNDGVSTPYYLSFNKDNMEFMISTEPSAIVLYHVSNGYNLMPVTNANQITEADSYLIVAENNGTSYLMGITYNDNLISNSFASCKTYSTASFPTSISLSQYNEIINYVWYNENTTTGTASFIDRASQSYYISNNNGLTLNANTFNWTYSQNGDYGRLNNGANYISFNNNSFTISNTAYNLKIYKLVPEDDTPLYISYDGAKKLEAESTLIEAGNYIISAFVNNNEYAIGETSTTALANTTTATLLNSSNPTQGNAYYWTVQDDSYSFVLRNKANTTSRLSSNTVNLNGSTSLNIEWMYDAINSRLYYVENDVTYYVTCTINNTTITWGVSSNRSNAAIIRLYKSEALYNITNIAKQDTRFYSYGEVVNNVTYNYYYFISYTDLTTNNPLYLLSYAEQFSSLTGNKSKETYQITGNKAYELDYNPYNSATQTISTTDPEIQKILFQFEGSNAIAVGYVDGTYYPYGSNSSFNLNQNAVTTDANKNKFGYLYSYYYYQQTSQKLYMACNNATGTRDIGFCTHKGARWGGSGCTDYNSAFVLNGTNRGQITNNSSTNSVTIGFVAGSQPYYMRIDYPTGAKIGIQKSNSAHTSSTPYVYRCQLQVSTVLTLISSNGDLLDDTINYVIAAKSNDKYYGVSYDKDASATNIYSTDVTSYVESIIKGDDSTINTSDDNVYSATVNVPKNCDWTCLANNISNPSQVMFYSTAFSTNTSKYYLSGDGTNLVAANITTGTTDNIMKIYYDIINKVLRCVVNNNTYYLTFNGTNFGLSNNIANAAEIHLFRYNAKYTIRQITSADQSLKDGDFIIAGHNADGYTGLGSNGAVVLLEDFTNYLTSEIDEETYKSIYSYIFTQSYYETNAFNASGTQFYFKMMNKSKIGSIAYKSTGSITLLYGYPYEYTWRMYLQSDGTWKFVNGQVIGTESVGAAGLKYTANNSSSNLQLNKTYKAISKYLSIDGNTNGSPVAIYEYANGEYTQVTGNITTGKTYVVLSRNATTGVYYLIGYDGSLKTTSIGKDLSAYQTYITDNTYLLNSVDYGTNNYGVSLQFKSNTSYYLTVNNSNNLAASTTKQYWDYDYDGVWTSRDSRLYTVTSATASGKLNPDGNKVTSGGEQSYLYIYNSTSHKYEIATSMSNGNNYALVMFKGGKYYVVSINDAGNVICKALGSGIPYTGDASAFGNNELWRYNGSQFTSVDSNYSSYYLGIGVDGGLKLVSDNPGISWSYSGSKATTKSSVDYVNSNPTTNATSLYLFNIRKSDSLSATADVDSPLNYHAKVEASISILQSQNYVVVAQIGTQAEGYRYYAMAMNTSDVSMALDITDTYNDALEGGSILLYESAVWEQLGSEYSLMFANQGFESETEPNTNNYDIEFNGNTQFYNVTINDNIYTIEGVQNSPVANSNYVILENASGTYYTYTINKDGKISKKEYDNQPLNVDVSEIWTFVSASSNVKTVTPYDMEIYIDDYYMLSGDVLDRTDAGSPTTIYRVGVPSGEEEFIWTIYPYGSNQYILGNYDTEFGYPSYLYFDTTDYLFKTTPSEDLAKTNKVQIYQLGRQVEDSQMSYQTFEIDMNEDGFTIDQFPLTQVEAASDVKKYTTQTVTGTIDTRIDGEYAIVAKDRNGYYALTLNDDNTLALRDISLLFGGNFLKDQAGNYCLSINERYIWKQTATPTYNNGVASGLNLVNVKLGTLLSIGSTTLSYDVASGQLYSGATYLHYSREHGFTTGANESEVEILLFAVGNNGIATGDDASLQYTYFSFALNTRAIDFSYFEFEKFQIEKLKNYSVDEIYTELSIASAAEFAELITNLFTRSGSGTLVDPYLYTQVEETASFDANETYYQMSLTLQDTIGWHISANEILTEANNSINYGSAIDHENYESVAFDYNYDDMETGEQSLKSGTYYAPKGTLSFVVPEASAGNPIFINVIVSTELNTNLYDESQLRYLSMWKVANIDAATATITAVDGETDITSAGAVDYQGILESKFYTPDSAIPLPNHYATAASGAAYVKVKNGGYVVETVTSDTFESLKSKLFTRSGAGSDADPYVYTSLESNAVFNGGTTYYKENSATTIYTLGTTANTDHNHLIAHTYTISTPGIYYVGATYGNVAFCYVSIDNRIEADAGEDNATNVSDAFSIDYVWGDIADSNSDFASDAGVGTIAYVGRKDEDDASLSWTHSNIYPELIFGTRGLDRDPEANQATADYNPTDYVVMELERSYDDTISTVSATCYTTAKIFADGNGIMYLNSNSAAQRTKRKLEFIIYQDDNKDLTAEGTLAIYGNGN